LEDTSKRRRFCVSLIDKLTTEQLEKIFPFFIMKSLFDNLFCLAKYFSPDDYSSSKIIKEISSSKIMDVFYIPYIESFPEIDSIVEFIKIYKREYPAYEKFKKMRNNIKKTKQIDIGEYTSLFKNERASFFALCYSVNDLIIKINSFPKGYSLFEDLTIDSFIIDIDKFRQYSESIDFVLRLLYKFLGLTEEQDDKFDLVQYKSIWEQKQIKNSSVKIGTSLNNLEEWITNFPSGRYPSNTYIQYIESEILHELGYDFDHYEIEDDWYEEESSHNFEIEENNNEFIEIPDDEVPF
jgi:hypothetical protein